MEKQKPLFRQKRFFWALFLTQALLVATHLGEFWPFSVYPMFSQAGRTWTRSLVRDVSETSSNQYWQSRTLETLPGKIFAMDEVGINQNDIANYIQKVDSWDAENKENIRVLFKSELADRKLLLYEVKGHLNDQKEVIQDYKPLLLMHQDSIILNPQFN